MTLIPTRWLFALVLMALVTRVAAQEVVFRTSVDLVTVDVTVVGRDGRPAGDLEPDDFVLKVDGRTRRVVSAQFVAQPAGGDRPRLLAARHFTSNEEADAGRLIVVAVDDAHIRRLEGRQALRAAGGFLDRLDPLDRVAVTSLSRVDVVQFTRDRTDLKRRLETFTGQTDPVFLQFNIGIAEAVEIADGGRARLAEVVLRECGRSLTDYINPARAADEAGAGRDACPERVEQEARAMSQHARTQARISLSALESLITALKSLPGPKTIVLLSEGMILDPRLVDVSNLAAAAKEARVAIYVLQMEVPIFEASQDRVSPTQVRDTHLRGDGLERLAGATRGAVFRLVGSDPAPFDRIADELSGYYLLAFEATDADRDGRVHRIDVSLTRRGGVVRARSAFRMPAVAPSPRGREEDLVRVLRGPITATELPVRVATYTYLEPGSDRVRVVVSAEIGAAAGASEVLLGYVLTDAGGVIVASGAHRAADGRHAFSAVVAPGAYTLRVGGLDLLGREGLVERPFAASVVSSSGLRVSDLILAPIPPQPAAALQPFVDRVWGCDVLAYLEIYAGSEQSLADARVTIGISAEGSDTAARTAAAELLQRENGWAIARVNVSLGTLPAGRYVAHAHIVVPGRSPTQVARPFTYERRDER
jgi:VWFA-related protein